MSGPLDVRVVEEEILVVAGQSDDINDLVAAITHDPLLAHLELKRADEERPLPGVALIRSAAAGVQDLAKAVRQFHPYAHPNHVIVQMTHGRVLPISYPRPGAGELPAAAPKKGVSVLVIDAGLVEPSPLGHRVDGNSAALPPGDVSVATLHGTFVAGLIHQREPRARIRVEKFKNPNGDGFISDWELANQLYTAGRWPDRPDIVSLSLGAIAKEGDEPKALKVAIAELLRHEIKVFAAAGNDGNDHEPVYPSAFDDVFAVGAQVLDGDTRRPADFSNGATTGGVDFWAPGVDVVSTTVDSDDPITFLENPDPENQFEDLPPSQKENVALNGWARWDGTSFATPILAAACATELIDRPGANPIPALRNMYGAKDNDTGFT